MVGEGGEGGVGSEQGDVGLRTTSTEASSQDFSRNRGKRRYCAGFSGISGFFEAYEHWFLLTLLLFASSFGELDEGVDAGDPNPLGSYQTELLAIRPYLGVLDPAFYTHSGFRLELWEICFLMLTLLKLVDLGHPLVVEDLESTNIW
ncbi:hypothetical protein M5K25_008209 [Dendrobium thyrsiflorum]|uniref:Uncharacterized protein n=1 Tax=Dendrobium thyrsiflorum TaxID=117978 RepID=A0ABD0VEX3_DENTH